MPALVSARSPNLALTAMALLLPLGCGATSRNPRESEGGTSTGGSASGTAAALTGGTEAEGGAAHAPPMNCAYPVQRPNTSTPDPNVTDYVLSSPFPVAVEPDAWGGFRGAYDVNGDLVDDLVYTHLTGQGRELRLLISSPPPRSLEHVPFPCPALEALPEGRVFLRELDDDGVLDFVIATDDHLYVFANHPEGFVQRLDYAWPEPNERASVIDVQVADLTNDQRRSLVVGYDRVKNLDLDGTEIGAMSFLASFATTDLVPWHGEHTVLGGSGTEPIFTGYFTTGNFGILAAGDVAVLALSPGDQPASLIARTTQFSDSVATEELRLPDFTDDVRRLFSTHSINHDELWVLGSEALYRVNVAAAPPSIAGTQPTVFQAFYSHEFGGGPERPRAHLLDLDGDADDDFIEISPDATQLALHVALDRQTFAEPQVIEAHPSTTSDSPFLVVGPTRALLEQLPEGPAQIRTLYSGKYQAQP